MSPTTLICMSTGVWVVVIEVVFTIGVMVVVVVVVFTTGAVVIMAVVGIAVTLKELLVAAISKPDVTLRV